MEFYAGEPIIGFRSWKIDEEEPILRASMVKAPWSIGSPTRATCVDSMFRRMAHDCPLDHDSPNDLCSCGIYGHYEPTPLNIEMFKSLPVNTNTNDNIIFGVILAWGRIHFHDKGYKAEFALPIAITDHFSLRDKEYKNRLEEIVFKYELTLLPERKLASYARKFGVDAKEYL